MSSSQSSSVVHSFSLSTTMNKLQTGIQSYYGPVKLSIQMENDYALSLLCAIIVGHVSLSFVDSFYFEECIQKIMLNWIVPFPTTFMDKYLVQLFATALENCNLKLKVEEVMTLLLDVWTDVSSNSIYGWILLFGYSESDILEILDFSFQKEIMWKICCWKYQTLWNPVALIGPKLSSATLIAQAPWLISMLASWKVQAYH